ncbi:hypothetical protein [Streptomyces sp. GbtcB6]|nr:hypothetical protein [Streptomyces sp. GbtcB6]
MAVTVWLLCFRHNDVLCLLSHTAQGGLASALDGEWHQRGELLNH